MLNVKLNKSGSGLYFSLLALVLVLFLFSSFVVWLYIGKTQNVFSRKNHVNTTTGDENLQDPPSLTELNIVGPWVDIKENYIEYQYVINRNILALESLGGVYSYKIETEYCNREEVFFHSNEDNYYKFDTFDNYFDYVEQEENERLVIRIKKEYIQNASKYEDASYKIYDQTGQVRYKGVVKVPICVKKPPI